MVRPFQRLLSLFLVVVIVTGLFALPSTTLAQSGPEFKEIPDGALEAAQLAAGTATPTCTTAGAKDATTSLFTNQALIPDKPPPPAYQFVCFAYDGANLVHRFIYNGDF